MNYSSFCFFLDLCQAENERLLNRIGSDDPDLPDEPIDLSEDDLEAIFQRLELARDAAMQLQRDFPEHQNRRDSTPSPLGYE